MTQISLAALAAKIAKLQAAYDARIAAGEVDATPLTAEQLPAGTKIEFNVKGKDGSVSVTVASVLAVVAFPKGGTIVKAITGTGADTRIVSPFLTQVRLVAEAAAE